MYGSPTKANPKSACSNCGATDLVMVARTSGVRGWKGYFCPTCLAEWLKMIPASYKYVKITITNVE